MMLIMLVLIYTAWVGLQLRLCVSYSTIPSSPLIAQWFRCILPDSRLRGLGFESGAAV